MITTRIPCGISKRTPVHYLEASPPTFLIQILKTFYQRRNGELLKRINSKYIIDHSLYQKVIVLEVLCKKRD